jgi:tRNA(Ile)-lysidine synthase
VSTADNGRPLDAAEIRSLFADLAHHPVLLLAVSGGPDSTALLLLAARWRKALKNGPKLVAVTVDHGLRPESRREAVAVARLARKLGVTHRTLRWTGRKPKTGIQQAARQARYRLLGEAARRLGSAHVLTAHTRDDQAETVLMRFVRGSGIEGLSGMGLLVPLPAAAYGSGRWLSRPLLEIPKARLVATLAAAKTRYAEDPSNRDPRFTRARLRLLMAELANEGLTAERLVLLARRALRADLALIDAENEARDRLTRQPWPSGGPVVLEARAFHDLPKEIGLRLLGSAIAWAGDEGPVELGKLEAMVEALHGPLAVAVRLDGGSVPFRRTLAGAVVTLKAGEIRVERAPARRRASKRP